MLKDGRIDGRLWHVYTEGVELRAGVHVSTNVTVSPKLAREVR